MLVSIPGSDERIGLTVSPTVSLTLEMQAFLRAYLARHPQVALDVVRDSADGQAPDVEACRADVGLVRDPQTPRSAFVCCTPLYSEALMVAVSHGDRWAALDAIEVGALRHASFVNVPEARVGGLAWRIAQLCRRHGIAPTPARAVSTGTAALALVESGFGIAIVPASFGQHAPPGVRLVPLHGAGTTSVLAAVHARRPRTVAKPFIDALAQRWGSVAEVG